MKLRTRGPLRRQALAAVMVPLLGAACTPAGGEKPPEASAPAEESAPATKAPPPAAKGFADVKALIEAGDTDGALAKLEGKESPEALYLQGLAWAKKAEDAPLPTPEALPPGSPKGAVPVTPEFKPEELHALELYEKAAAAALPTDGRSHLGIARLLAPHAQRRYDAEQAAAASAAKKPARGKGKLPAAPTPPPGPDASARRVSHEYHLAVQAQPKDAVAVEELIAFSSHTQQFEDASWALQQAIEHDKENPERLVRYGDFLFAVKKDYEGAIAQYRQALIWQPDNLEVKSKIADVYVAAGRDHFDQTEWASAEVSYREALKYVPDRSSDQYKRIQGEIEKLKDLRN